MDTQPLKDGVPAQKQLASSKKEGEWSICVKGTRSPGSYQLLEPRMTMMVDRGDSRGETCSGRGSGLSQCEWPQSEQYALKKQFSRNAD